MSQQSQFQSQIRDSQKNALAVKVSKKNYDQYLIKVNLGRVRAFTDKMVTFDFPVTALVGPNGAGKTTILGAAATLYSAIKPRQFFSKTDKYDASMSNWRIEYEFIDRQLNRNDSIRRTASFHKQKWSRDAVKRDIVVFGVIRTVPANERVELQRFTTKSLSINTNNIDALKGSVADAVSKILGKDVSKYTHIRVDDKGKISLLTGETDNGVGYSEFHFGAGEASIIRMVMKIENMNDNCLILIEEIENGLHPVATIRMVEYLIDVATRKNAQAIFTTHSNEALRPLPNEAIWAAIGGDVFQGKLDISSLRTITGQIEASLAIFCEDSFATHWIRGILRAKGGLAVDGIEIHAMKGDGTAVKLHIHHNLDPSVPFPSICIIDGDSKQKDSHEKRIFRLPGQSPEAYVFDKVLEKSETIGGILSVRLHQKHENTDSVLEKLRRVRITNHDPHVLYSQVGNVLGLLPESTMRDAFITTWAEAWPEEVDALLSPIMELLPQENSMP